MSGTGEILVGVGYAIAITPYVSMMCGKAINYLHILKIQKLCEKMERE